MQPQYILAVGGEGSLPLMQPLAGGREAARGNLQHLREPYMPSSPWSSVCIVSSRSRLSPPVPKLWAIDKALVLDGDGDFGW